MKRGLALLALLALLGFAAAGCGTSNGPTANGGDSGATPAAGTQGQDTNSQPAAGGLKNGAYTAAQTMCSMYPLSQLAAQNGLPSNATKQQVAKKVSDGETTKADKASALRGCLAGLNSG
jgi:hypothetical protein